MGGSSTGGPIASDVGLRRVTRYFFDGSKSGILYLFLCGSPLDPIGRGLGLPVRSPSVRVHLFDMAMHMDI